MPIYRHEGRSWYTSHRGRLWIHAAGKEPDPQTIAELETFYRSRSTNNDDIRLSAMIYVIYFCLDDRELDFPTDYPTSVLLGCVDVIDCLDRESYEEQYPGGESDCEYVFICENPQELMFKLPMRGHQKICKSIRFNSLF